MVDAKDSPKTVREALRRLAREGAELGLSYAEHDNTTYLLIPLFEGFDIAATLPNLDEKVVLKACIKQGDKVKGIYGNSTCRHTVINYEDVDGLPGKKLGQQEVKLSGLDDLGAFLMSWDAWRQYGNRYGEVFDPQIITQLLDDIPAEKRPAAAMRWFEEKTFNDLEEILKWDRPDHEFQKSRHGQALYVLGRTLSTEAVDDYVPVHFLDLVKEKLDKYLPLLFDVLKEGDANKREGCINALVNIGKKAIPCLMQGLKDEEWTVRYACARALGNLGSEKAIPALTQGLKDGYSYVRGACANALKKIKQKNKVKVEEADEIYGTD